MTRSLISASLFETNVLAKYRVPDSSLCIAELEKTASSGPKVGTQRETLICVVQAQTGSDMRWDQWDLPRNVALYKGLQV